MSDPDLLKQHSRELAASRVPIYTLFTVLDELDLPEETRVPVQAELARLTEFAVWQELRANAKDVEKALRTILNTTPEAAARITEAWRKALEAALPSRGSCKMVLLEFPDYLNQLPEALRDPFMRGMAPLCPYLSDWGNKDIEKLLKAMSAVETPERMSTLLTAIAHYKETDAKIMGAAVRVVATLLTANRDNLVATLVQTVSVEQMYESRDACRLLPALSRAMSQAGPTGAALCDCILTIAKDNPSSAYDATRTLHKLAQKMPEESFAAYARAVDKLTGEGSIRLLGFCLRELPKLYKKHTAERMTAFVDMALDACKQYGVTAAVAFLEQDTPTARDALKG
jgi:hypothetical protein